MLTGSMASSMLGAPRLTHDIDLVVALSADDCDALFEAFDPAAFYLSRPAMSEAVAQRRRFNLLEYATGDKVDFWILTDEPFDGSRFERKRATEFLGSRLKVSTPEDTILAKLRWARLAGGSENQLADVRSLCEFQETLDLAYIERWAEDLGVESLWSEIRATTGPGG
jgi:hypothetical protein